MAFLGLLPPVPLWRISTQKYTDNSSLSIIAIRRITNLINLTIVFPRIVPIAFSLKKQSIICFGTVFSVKYFGLTFPILLKNIYIQISV